MEYKINSVKNAESNKTKLTNENRTKSKYYVPLDMTKVGTKNFVRYFRMEYIDTQNSTSA